MSDIKDSKKIKRMTVKEFRSLGLLHEVNRKLLHPLGLALEVVREENGSERFGEVWDYRDDLEGIRFAEDVIDQLHIDSVKEMKGERFNIRVKALGYWIQTSHNKTIGEQIQNTVDKQLAQGEGMEDTYFY